MFQYEPTFNGGFSRNNLPRIKDGVRAINLDDKKVKEHIGFDCLLREMQLYTLIFFEFNIILNQYKCIMKINLINQDKSIMRNIVRTKNNESVMLGFYCIAFIEHMLAGKALLDYTHLFSPNDYKKNGKRICKCFKEKYVKS